LLRLTRGIITALLCLAAGALTAQEPSQSVRDGVFTDSQAARGAEGFATSCAACHGASLSGVGEAPGLIGGQFISDFDGLTVAELFDRIRATMPMTAPGSLKREQYAEILAFVLKSNGFPSGQRELDYRSEYLSDIRFQAPN
jgi:mono/diheme cytochrome c family protein